MTETHKTEVHRRKRKLRGRDTPRSPEKIRSATAKAPHLARQLVILLFGPATSLLLLSCVSVGLLQLVYGQLDGGSQASSSTHSEGQAASASSQQDQTQEQLQALIDSILPAPQQRPNVRVNIREWTRRIGEDIRLVSNRTSCVQRIARLYETDGEFQQLDPVRARESILSQINSLLAQHKAAVNNIVLEAERAAIEHRFIKNLRMNYTDVHRIRNELEPWSTANLTQEQLNDYTTNQYGNPSSLSSGSGGGTGGDRPQFTAISGGTPVPGPPEWQTPIRSIVMQMNRNFGDIPVNTSMSAVHLPLPIYPGLPEIMNGIAWTERLDQIFKRNLLQYMHVHHQYYGDRLGFLRTFPAHKWRIPRNEPDLFDARTRPWYIAGAAMPKDVVILVDTSGSMTGLRREIARGVVFEILDTLTINDHFAVMRFSETVTPVGLPKCNLKTPRLVPQLDELCSQAASLGLHQVGPTASASQARTLMDHVTGSSHSQQSHPNSNSNSNSNSKHPHPTQADQRRELQTECANWRRQWTNRDQYLRDHPDVVLGKNGSYMDDDAYRDSIANVTMDIRDAFLLPATSRNIRYLKSNFSMPTAGIANFTRALMAGFELLQAYNRSQDLGSQCNQAIMLITDGAIKSHEDVFNRYNYPSSSAPIRVFTYMIGREVGDIRPTKEMACRNRGYYAHVINLGEVREQVQKYLPVMARPLVLAHNHPTTWTNAYGDETYQVLTDWVLEVKRRERARLMLNEERERQSDVNAGDVINTELTGLSEYDDMPQVDELMKNRIICEDSADNSPQEDQSLEEEVDPLGHNDLVCHWTGRRAELLTSVVKPVFDLRNTSIFFERYLSKNVWQEKDVHLRNAQLLGVAAVDLRIDDIVKAAPSHLLGPNGYPILLGQNGFVMHHPDFRALLEDPFDKQSKILKPYFSAVDLSHIEQVFHKNELDANKRRDDDMKLLKLREAAAKRATGFESMYVKRTMDCRRRPHVRLQTFYYGPIKDTPYAFMLALPQSYGLNRIQAKLPLDKNSYNYLKPSDYDLWTVHPDYRYCELSSSAQASSASPAAAQTQAQNQLHLNDSLQTLIRLLNSTAEGELYEFEYEDLSAISGSSNPPSPASNEQQLASLRAKQQLMQQQGRYSTAPLSSSPQVVRYICDKELFPSLLFDAKATYDSFVAPSMSRASDSDGTCSQTSEEMRTKLAQIYGLEMSFVATKSGLTRTRIFDDSPRIKKLAKLFIERHGRAVDESWYARTVDWNIRFSDESTIITVPYNAYARLIAKLRQRITQRQPVAGNASRTNCDPEPDEVLEQDLEEGGSGGQVAAESGLAVDPSTTPEQGGGGGGGPRQLEPTPAAPTSAEQQQMQNDQSSGGNALVDQAQPEDVHQLQNDQQEDTPGSESNSTEQQPPPAPSEVPKVNYAEYSSFDFLDLLANSSVHVSATQSITVNGVAASGGRGQQPNKKNSKTPVGVTGRLYDYATFARKFLNSTSLDIRTYNQQQQQQQQNSAADGLGLGDQAAPLHKVDICPNADCPTRCGFRNDSIDCLLVDNNGFIVVGEELPHIGRSLVDYDERLMASLVERKVFHAIQIIDYQAICARPDQTGVWLTEQQQQRAAAAAAAASQAVQLQVAAPLASGNMSSALLMASSSSSSGRSLPPAAGLKLELLQAVVANLARALVWSASTLYSALLLRSATPNELEPEELFGADSLLGRLHQWQRSALLAEAQSAVANQSLLALLPNKTYLRPCEKTQTLYETRPHASEQAKLYSDTPEYFVTRCGCSGWYVFDLVPKTNLLMLIVNMTSVCRRCSEPFGSELLTSAASGGAGAPQAGGSGGGQGVGATVPLAPGSQVPIISPLVDLQAPPSVLRPLASSPDSSWALGGGGQPTWSRSLAEDQVCAMLERDQPLYVQKPGSCMTQHPDEAQIHICGSGARVRPHALLVVVACLIAWLGASSFAYKVQDPRRAGADSNSD